MLSTLPPEAERLDLVFWDYGCNDMAINGFSFRQQNNGAFFFPHLFYLHPDIAGVGLVHWLETTNCTLKENGTVSTNKIATDNYPYLKHMFHPNRRNQSSQSPSRIAPFANVSVFALSLPQFCNAGFCNPFDYIREDSRGHPSDAGIAIMADLVIWNLLPYFDALIAKHCRRPALHSTNISASSSANSTRMNDHHLLIQERHSDSYRNASEVRTIGGISVTDTTAHEVDWFVDAKLADLTPQEMDAIDREYVQSQSRLKHVVAAMFLISPIMRSSLAIDQFTIRCVKNDGSSVWVQVDVLRLIEEKCLGWINRQHRKQFRSDEEFYFHPNVIPGTLRNGTWEGNDRVRNADILLRLHTSVAWTYICFQPCTPTGRIRPYIYDRMLSSLLLYASCHFEQRMGNLSLRCGCISSFLFSTPSYNKGALLVIINSTC